MSQSIFLTGGTGYVGGCFLNRLLDGLYPSGTITALTRSSEKAKLVETLSTDSVKIKALEGSFSDLDLLEKAAYEHDIIIEAGDSDNPDLVNALLKGIKKRFDEGKETTFIHVSGTGTLADDARGEFKTKDIYTDMTPEEGQVSINDLSESAFHRKIDISIYEADKKGWCKSYLIFPGTIWGEGRGGVYDIGLAGKHSKQIPQQVESSIPRKQAGMVGKGLNVWAHVHIEDLATHFDLVYAEAMKGGKHGYEGNYLAVAGEYQLLEATKRIASTMKKNGWSDTDEISPFTEDELTKYYGAIEKIGGSKYYSGTNSRGVSANATRLGWKPKHTDVNAFYDDYVVSETERVGQEAQQKK